MYPFQEESAAPSDYTITANTTGNGKISIHIHKATLLSSTPQSYAYGTNYVVTNMESMLVGQSPGYIILTDAAMHIGISVLVSVLVYTSSH